MCALCHIITASAAPAHTYLHTFDWKVQPQRRKACKCTFNLALTHSHIKSTSLSGRAVQQLVHRSLFSKLDTLTGAYSSLQVLLWNSRGRRKSAHSEVYILYIIRFAFCGRNWVLDAQEKYSCCVVLERVKAELCSLWLTVQFSNNQMNTCNMANSFKIRQFSQLQSFVWQKKKLPSESLPVTFACNVSGLR